MRTLCLSHWMVWPKCAEWGSCSRRPATNTRLGQMRVQLFNIGETCEDCTV